MISGVGGHVCYSFPSICAQTHKHTDTQAYRHTGTLQLFVFSVAPDKELNEQCYDSVCLMDGVYSATKKAISKRSPCGVVVNPIGDLVDEILPEGACNLFGSGSSIS